MTKIIVSGCLLGFPCRYDGKDCYLEKIEELKEKHTLIPVCPEQMGGLPTPRHPSEIRGNKLMNNIGEDVTENDRKGADTALCIAKMNHVQCALFKQKSPSCGHGVIYDGTFTGTKIPGNGVTSQLFEKNGIRVFSEDEFEDLKEFIDKYTD